jgi:DNA helicase-4
MGLFTKNEAKEYKDLDAFGVFLDSLMSSDEFISRKAYLSSYNVLFDTYSELSLLEERNVLQAWCKSNKVDYKKLLQLLNKYKNIHQLVKKHNDEYVRKHLNSDKQYLDEVLLKDDPNIKLDEEQRKVVLSDEDYTLVIAGAGAGKTTTIEAKVKYLVDKKAVDPDRVLIVSFTRKATEELRERFKRLGLPVNIATFHSIGNTIIKESDQTRHQIVEGGFMFNTIRDYLVNKLDDGHFIKRIVLFFASYLTMPFDETNTSLLFKTLQDNENITLKTDLTNMLDDYHKAQTKQKITIRDERVRSIDECRIANFLFINGIDYMYEPVYKYGFKDTTKPYCPDFLIKQGDKEIYLEHFGVSEDWKNNRFSQQELDDYKKHARDKIILHREHGTKLIYTFSKYNDGRDLVTHLKEILEEAGLKLSTQSDIEIYKQIAKSAEDKYFNKFITLVCNFINRFKVNNYTEEKFDDWRTDIKDERTKLFLYIARQCYRVYEAEKDRIRAIDFEDMINDASNVLDGYISKGEKLPYDYILVDEYQDISLQRFDLCEKLSKASDAKIIAVGDDWQSIFKFSGAKIDLFTKFEDRMGYANVLKITKTYRNSQELIDIAGNFVMSNEEQIKKNLKSNKSIKDPVILMSYNDAYEKDENNKGPFYRLGEAIEKSLEDIVAKCGEEKTILLIGRYNFDGRKLGQLEDLFEFNKGKVISKKYPKLDITFLTAHSSKGLGYDNVIVINGKDDVLGFPSKIEDDPVMKLVIKDDDSIDFAEERRLFYVALTRTKNRVYIVTPQLRPSKFILEIKDKFTNVILRGTELNPVEGLDFRRKCPICGYPLQHRKGNFKFLKGDGTLWVCSNDPEVCGFITNDVRGGRLSISKCPSCEDGYLIVKPIKNKEGEDTGQRMLGCTNYKPDGTGCSFAMFPHNYTQDKGQIAIEFFDSKVSMKDMVTMGYPIKDLVYNIINIINKIIGSYKNFELTFMTLVSFLKGQETKAIEAFKMNELPGYGFINEKYHKRVVPLLKEMKNQGIIDIVKDKYEIVKVVNAQPDDETLKAVFTGIIPKDR